MPYALYFYLKLYTGTDLTPEAHTEFACHAMSFLLFISSHISVCGLWLFLQNDPIQIKQNILLETLLDAFTICMYSTCKSGHLPITKRTALQIEDHLTWRRMFGHLITWAGTGPWQAHVFAKNLPKVCKPMFMPIWERAINLIARMWLTSAHSNNFWCG